MRELDKNEIEAVSGGDEFGGMAKKQWARTRVRPFRHRSVCIIMSLLAGHACAEPQSSRPDLKAAFDNAEDVIVWDDTTSTSSIDWRRAYEVYPPDALYLLGVSYGSSVSERLAITPEDPKVTGTIGYDLEQSLRQLDDRDTVYIFSGGGRVRAAVNAFDVILEKELSFVVIGLCASACVEDILPAAKSVTAFDRPIFAVHGNMHSYLEHLKQGGEEPCHETETPAERIESLETLVERIDQRLLKTGHKTDFWKKQIEVLGEPTIVGFDTGEGDCGTIQQFSVDYWLPTSEEFRTYFGLEVEGPLCNDSQECLDNKLPLSLEVGDKVVSGHKVITVSLPELDAED